MFHQLSWDTDDMKTAKVFCWTLLVFLPKQKVLKQLCMIMVPSHQIRCDKEGGSFPRE